MEPGTFRMFTNGGAVISANTCSTTCLPTAAATVLDIDYRGQRRLWTRLAYRHLPAYGGKDLSDQVDGVNWLVKTMESIRRTLGFSTEGLVGLYYADGAVYRGKCFAAEAGLRSVTDWTQLHNPVIPRPSKQPYNDSIAYRRSSPLYFAEEAEREGC